MTSTVNGTRSAPLTPFAVKARLVELQAEYEKEPSQWFTVAQHLSELLPVAEGDPSPNDRSMPETQLYIVSEFEQRMDTRMGKENVVQQFCTAIKTGKVKAETQKPLIEAFMKACFKKDGVSVKSNFRFFKEFVQDDSTKKHPIRMALVCIILSPFILTGILLYYSIRLPLILRDKIARRETYSPLVGHMLVLDVKKKLAQNVTVEKLLGCINQVIEDYEGLKTSSSDASKKWLRALKNLQEVVENDLKSAKDTNPSLDASLVFAKLEHKDSFYTLVRGYMLTKRDNRLDGSAPKNAGKALHRVLSKRLDEFVQEDAPKSSTRAP